MLAARLEVSPESAELIYNACGKPAIAVGLADLDLRFNVSHCDDVGVYAFSYGLDVGVDIEAVRTIPDGDAIANQFFSTHENEAYRVLDAGDKPRGFFNCWTRKEAFVNALDRGLGCPLYSFDVSLAPEQPAKILRVGTMPGNQCGWYIESLSPLPGFVAAMAAAISRLNSRSGTMAGSSVPGQLWG